MRVQVSQGEALSTQECGASPYCPPHQPARLTALAESANYVGKLRLRLGLILKQWQSLASARALAIVRWVRRHALSPGLAVLALLGGYESFREKISIEPHFSQDPRFALSTRFKVQNNEPFGAQDMVFGCQVGPFWTSGNQGQEPVLVLDAGKSVERDCSISGPLRPQAGTRLTWVVEYRPWFRWWRRASFQSFVARSDSSSRAHWSPEQTSGEIRQQISDKLGQGERLAAEHGNK